MLIKAVILFLGVMVLLGMVGNWLFPGAIKRGVAKRLQPTKCTRCGKFQIGRTACGCGRKG
jgi:putative copper export protein